jgi:hypothetical protein
VFEKNMGVNRMNRSGSRSFGGPTMEILERLNALSLNGPMANREYFQRMMEGFQTTTATTTAPTSAPTAATTTASAIDTALSDYDAAQKAYDEAVASVRASLKSYIEVFQTSYNTNKVYLTTASKSVPTEVQMAYVLPDNADLDTMDNQWTVFSGLQGALDIAISASADTSIAAFGILRDTYNRFRSATEVLTFDAKDVQKTLEAITVSAPLKGTDTLASMNTNYSDQMNFFLGHFFFFLQVFL